jgi:DNA-directed RNA polymerase alpha subunit
MVCARSRRKLEHEPKSLLQWTREGKSAAFFGFFFFFFLGPLGPVGPVGPVCPDRPPLFLRMSSRRGPIGVEVKELSDDAIVFYVKGIDLSLTNALRRIMIAEVETLAIEMVEVEENDTVLFDEFLVHRMGLVPFSHVDGIKGVLTVDSMEEQDSLPVMPQVRLDVRYGKYPGASAQEGWLVNGYPPLINTTTGEREFNKDIRVVGAGGDYELDTSPEATGEYWVVTSKQMFLTGQTFNNIGGDGGGGGGGGDGDESYKNTITPVHYSNPGEAERSLGDDGIRIVKMRRGQRLNVTGYITRGIGKEHAKFSPACVATFKPVPIIKLNQNKLSELTIEQKRGFVDSCARDVFELDEATGVVSVAEHGELEYAFDEECILYAETLKATPEDESVVSITELPHTYLFTVESSGALPPEEIVARAFTKFGEKLDAINSDLSLVDPNGSSREEIKTGFGGGEIGGYMRNHGK